MKAVIFDLDGTLLDSSQDVWDCVQDGFEAIGRDFPPELRVDNRLLSLNLAGILRTAYPDAGDDECEELKKAVRRLYQIECTYEKTSVYPGIQELLDWLKANGVRMFIATLKSITPAQQLLECKGLRGYFECILTPDAAEGVKLQKPEMLARLKEEYALTAEDCCMVGDSPGDIVAAKKNGLPSIFVSWGDGRPEWVEGCEPDEVVDTVEELGRMVLPERK